MQRVGIRKSSATSRKVACIIDKFIMTCSRASHPSMPLLLLFLTCMEKSNVDIDTTLNRYSPTKH